MMIPILTAIFAQPLALWGLLALVLAAGLWWVGSRRWRQAVARLGDNGVVRRLLAQVNHNGRFAQHLLWLFTLAALTIALARPQWGSQTERVQQEGLQIIFVLDVSPSMLVADVAPSRLEVAKQTIGQLIAELPQHEIGLILFSGVSQTYLPLTRDHSTAQTLLAQASPNLIPRPGTAVAAALETASQNFNPKQAVGRVIVLFSDGEDHQAQLSAAIQAVQRVEATLYTIGVGTADGGAVPVYDQQGNFIEYKKNHLGAEVVSQANSETLETLVEGGNGRFFPAATALNLLPELDKLETAQQRGQWQTQPIERFQLFLLLALLALVAIEWIPDRRKVGVETAVLSQPTLAFRAKQLAGLLLISFLLLALLACTGQQKLAREIQQGNLAFQQNKPRQAQAAYALAQTRAPERIEPAYNQANLSYRQNDYPEATDTLRQTIPYSERQQIAAAFHNLGNSYFQQQQWEQAVQAYQQALRYNAADVDTKYNLELATQWQETESIEQQNEDDDFGEGSAQAGVDSQQDQTNESDSQEQTTTAGTQLPNKEPHHQFQEQGQSFTPMQSTPPDPNAPQTDQEPVEERFSRQEAYVFLTEIGQHAETVLGQQPQPSDAPPLQTQQKDW